MERTKEVIQRNETTKGWDTFSELINKKDIFYKNYCSATFRLFDISATQNLNMQSEFKHFPQMINFDLFPYLKIILLFI